MPTAADLRRQAKAQWIRAEALAAMFQRRSRLSGRWSVRLAWGSIALGTGTGIAGALTAVSPEMGAGSITGFLGVGTGVINTIRERLLPPDLEKTLWSRRNSVARLQEQLGDVYDDLADGAVDVPAIDIRFKEIRQALRDAEESPHANHVSDDDKKAASRACSESIQFAVNNSTDDAPDAEAQDEKKDASEIRKPQKGSRS